jgi:hypothetical protein
MMKGTAFAERYLDHAPFRLIGGLADGFRYLTGLTGTVTDPAPSVADHHQGTEGKPAATLDHLGDTVDVDQLV